METEIAKRNEQIQSLETSLADVKNRFQQQSLQDASEVQFLRQEIKALREENLDWQQKFNAVLNQKNMLEEAVGQNSLQTPKQFTINRPKPTRSEMEDGPDNNSSSQSILVTPHMRPSSGLRKKVPKVRGEDIKHIGAVVSYRMRAQRISWEEAEKVN